MEESDISLDRLARHFEAHNRSEGKSPQTIIWYSRVLRYFGNYLKEHNLPDHLENLDVEVASKEKREAELIRRVEALEQRAWSAEEKLAAARNGLKLLGELGLSPDGLSGLAQRLSGIAQRHGIQPEALRDRLQSELERLEDCLTLEAAVEVRKHDLARLEQGVSAAEEQRTVETSAVKDLRRQKVRLEKAVQDETALLRKEIAAVTKASRDAMGELTRGVSVALAGATAPVEQLRDKALELGRELGQYQAIIDSSEHIRGLSSLITGNSKLTAGQTRVILLAVMRPAGELMKMNMSQLSLPKDLMTNLDWCIKDLEKWQT